MDVDRRRLAGQLDDIVIGLRRLTLNRQGLSLPATATPTTLCRSGDYRLTDLAISVGVRRSSMTALVGRPAEQGLVRRRTDPLDGLDDGDAGAISAALPALARLAGVLAPSLNRRNS
jgi:hypothetical protein